MEDVISEQGLHTSQFIGEDVQNILGLPHTALKIRADVKHSPQYGNCASVNIDDAAKLVPQSLCLFLSVLLTC